MDINEIQAYFDKEYPELRLNTGRSRPHGTIDVVGRIQYGFSADDRTQEPMLDNAIRNQMESLIELAQDALDKMKIKNGIEQEILGVQAVLVEGGEYWVSEESYTKLLNEGGEGPQSEAAMAFGGKRIRYHESL